MVDFVFVFLCTIDEKYNVHIVSTARFPVATRGGSEGDQGTTAPAQMSDPHPQTEILIERKM